ncbi:hypothetical protein CFC21_083211, partial [Triticum aestivum]
GGASRAAHAAGGGTRWWQLVMLGRMVWAAACAIGGGRWGQRRVCRGGQWGRWRAIIPASVDVASVPTIQSNGQQAWLLGRMLNHRDMSEEIDFILADGTGAI